MGNCSQHCALNQNIFFPLKAELSILVVDLLSKNVENKTLSSFEVNRILEDYKKYSSFIILDDKNVFQNNFIGKFEDSLKNHFWEKVFGKKYFYK